MSRVCQKDDDQIRKEDPVLGVLCPQGAQVKGVGVRLKDDIDIAPLVQPENVDGIFVDEPEVGDHWKKKAEDGQHGNQTL